MFKILDRYVVREVLLPFFLSLLVLTFVLEIPPILQQSEQLIAKGVGWMIVARVLATLLPQALGLTIPMAVLLALLIGLGRLSADREFVAMQACGVSIFRMLRPIAVLSLLAAAATAYVMIVALPAENQRFREITFNILASSSEGDVKARVFYQGFGANRALYVRDVAPTGGWRDVFLADTAGNETTAYFAKQGRLLIDRNKKTVELLLEQGTRHTTYLDKPVDYNGGAFDRLILSIDADTVFPRTTVLPGDNEMTIAELRAKIAENTKNGLPSNSQRFTIQQKFAFPAACVVLGVIGLALGVSNRKDGTLGGFVMGFIVVMIYYFLLWTSRGMALSGKIHSGFAPWIANIVFALAGAALVVWRAGTADRAIRISLPNFRRAKADEPVGAMAAPGSRATRRGRIVVVVRIPKFYLPRPRLLDIYVAGQYLRVFGLGLSGLLGLFYIATVIDMADRLFRGSATPRLMLQYLYFETPRYGYYIIPISALVASLVVIGSLTKNSELIVMRACGVSLYRSAVPLLLFAVLLSGVLFELQERVLAYSNRKADALLHQMRGFPAQTFGVLNRRWIVGNDGDIYHYEYFDPRQNTFSRLTMFDLDAESWRLASLTYAKEVQLMPAPGSAADEADGSFEWQGRDGWKRAFITSVKNHKALNRVNYTPFPTVKLPLEAPSYFKTDEPDAERMTYAQLKSYIEQLRTSGFQVVPYMVQLQRKVAFPFVTVIMTLLAVPFAVTTGRRGALAGIGVGIVMAIVYWTTQSVFGAVGAGGLINPTLAAWAANILFGAAAAYMILTVRT
jgi:LPS export ABC transporter permease LptG/LPS export ABC transporter permease LptF